MHLSLIGSKALQFFRRLKLPIVASITNIGDKPRIKDLIGGVDAMLELYRDGKIDRLFVAGNRFVNTMTQQAGGEADAAGRRRSTRASCRSAGTTSTSPRRTSSSPAS